MQYDDEFKKESIRLAKEGNKSRLAIAMDLGVAPSTFDGQEEKGISAGPTIERCFTELKRTRINSGI